MQCGICGTKLIGRFKEIGLCSKCAKEEVEIIDEEKEEEHKPTEPYRRIQVGPAIKSRTGQ